MLHLFHVKCPRCYIRYIKIPVHYPNSPCLYRLSGTITNSCLSTPQHNRMTCILSRQCLFVHTYSKRNFCFAPPLLNHHLIISTPYHFPFSFLHTFPPRAPGCPHTSIVNYVVCTSPNLLISLHAFRR